jgi:hypothetical protein
MYKPGITYKSAQIKKIMLYCKSLLPNQLSQLIENSLSSGIISIKNAHQLIRNSYNLG